RDGLLRATATRHAAFGVGDDLLGVGAAVAVFAVEPAHGVACARERTERAAGVSATVCGFLRLWRGCTTRARHFGFLHVARARRGFVGRRSGRGSGGGRRRTGQRELVELSLGLLERVLGFGQGAILRGRRLLSGRRCGRDRWSFYPRLSSGS